MSTKDAYMNISCASCEAQFGVEYSPIDTDDREPEYCPFCGDEILGTDLNDYVIGEDDEDSRD